MEIVGLPKLYVDKLGHNIEEIRLRALNHIIFKLEHELISSKQLALNSEFVKQLLRWFDFEPIKEEEKIINLLLDIIANNEDARRYWQYIGVPNHLRSIRKKISPKQWKELDKLLDLVLTSENNDPKIADNDTIPFGVHERAVETELSSFAAYFEGEAVNDELQQSSYAVNHSNISCHNKGFSHQSKLIWFPMQSLSPGDFHILSSVEHSLSMGLDKHMQGIQDCSINGIDKSDVDQEDTLIRCCQFIFDVILRDFLPEVFLQQSGISSTLLDLLSTLGGELEPGFTDGSNDGKTAESLLWVIKCLHRLATSLHTQLLFYADPSIQNLKDNSAINSSQSTPTPSSCSLTISPNVENHNLRHQTEGTVRCADHLSLPSENTPSPVNQTAGFDCSSQFSLPHFCISVLFQTLSLLATHLSGSHSSIFQSLMALSTASIQLLSQIVDPDMWVSASPISAAITGGISEIFRLIGEGLLGYQRTLSQKKNNSFSTSSKLQFDVDDPSILSTKPSKYSFEADFESHRLSYLQTLFLAHSFLGLAPKEPSLCRSSIPKELSQALMIAVFDPPFHLLLPKVHHDLLKIAKFVAPEAGRVCEQAIKIAESVKMGIKILRGTKKSYQDINKALLGLGFHESPEILRKCWDCCTVIDLKEVSELEKHLPVDQFADKSALYKKYGSSLKMPFSRNLKTSPHVCSKIVENSEANLGKFGESNRCVPAVIGTSSKLSGQAESDHTSEKSSTEVEYNLEDKEAILSKSEKRILVILKLLGHESCIIRKEIYSICWEMVTKVLGTASAKDFQPKGSRRRNLKNEKWKIEQLSFVWNRSVFTEIVAHGATSTDSKIQNCAKEIILFVLKSKIFVGEKIWDQIMETLLPCLPLLQCFADSVTPLGKTITKMFDPDMSLSIGMNAFDDLRGNCRLLFNSETAVRDEAAIRLAWMLSHENQNDSSRDVEVTINSWKNVKNRLPDRDTLASSGHSALANAFVFRPQDHSLNLRPKSYPSSSTNQAESIVQLLSLIGKKSDGNISLSDARVCRSALNQLALMLEHNAHLHSIFIQNNGLDIIMKTFQGALVEDDHEHYPDCAVPIVAILKNIAHWNSKVRKELSQLEVLYHCILRATVLFYDEKAFRCDAAHLFCLLLFTDYILLLLPCPSPHPPSVNSLSLPYLLTQRICFPFQCASHWRTSRHSITSPLSPNLMPERDTPLPEGCMSWKGIEKYKESLPWQGLIRLHSSWEWHGREGLLSFSGKKKLPVGLKDKKDEGLQYAFPPLLQLSSSEVSDLKATDIAASCRSLLFEIQNATTHTSVEKSLHRLRGYTSLWNTIFSECGEMIKPSSDIGLLPWNATLGRFLSRSPASHQDSELLIQICIFLQTAGEGLAAKQILGTEDTTGQNHNWLEGLMRNPTTLQPLLCPFSPPSPMFPETVCFTQEAFDGCPLQRAVCREVLSLIRELAVKGETVNGAQDIGWAYAIYFIAHSLQFGDAEHFYDLAFLEWALSCLVQLTGKPGWGHGVNEITATINKNKSSLDQIVLWEGLISGLIELLTAFHHGGQPLPNWASEEGRTELSEKGFRNICSQRRHSNNTDELLSAESLEVSGSFMGLSITRSALLCLNHVLSEMQDACTKPSQANWEIIWSKVLMNAGRNERRGQLRSLWHESLQGWLLPLWSSRDPIVRAAALKLAGGLAAVSSPALVPDIAKNAKKIQSAQTCDEPPLGLRLLEEGLAGKPGGVWGTALSIFLDHFESNLVREQAALLLTNLIAASEKIHGQSIDILLQDKLLFKEIGVLASQLFIGRSILQPVVLSSALVTDCVHKGEVKYMAWSTPSLLQAACQLLTNIMSLNPNVVPSAMWEGNGFLFRRLYGCLGKIPKEEKKDHVEIMLYVDTLGLYSELLSLLTSVILWDDRLVMLLPQPSPLTSVFLLLESKHYRVGIEFEDLKNKLWRNVFGFTSAALGSLIDRQEKSSRSNDAVAPKKYYSVFLEAAYNSIIENDLDLKKAALCSLNALFSIELQHSICHAEVLEPNKDEEKETSPLLELLQEPCDEHGEMEEGVEAINHRSLEEVNEKENQMLTSNSASKLCHILIQLYEPERVVLPEVSVTLSSLLALSIQAKWCALSSGLVENLVVRGRHLHISIVMGESEDPLFTQAKLNSGAVCKKQQPKLWMNDLSLLFRLLTNFLHSGDFGCIPQEISSHSNISLVKLEAVKLGLSDLLHKLFPFAMLATSLLSDFLRLLTTFTTDCPPACQSLVYTSKTVSIGPRQNLASSSLLHLLCELAPKETDSLLFTHTTNQSKNISETIMKQSDDILSMVLASLRNACEVQECRMIMAKGALFQSLIKLHPSEKRSNQQLLETIEDLWLSFLLHFTSFSEGQLSVPKIPDMFDLLLSLAKKATPKRDTFMSVLRNLAFHPQNRSRLLSCDEFLQILVQVLNKTDGSIWHKEVVGSTVWALSANSYKGKQILKGAGLDSALKVGISHLRSAVGITEEVSNRGEGNKIESDVERIANILNCALNVLGCEEEKRCSL